MPCRYSSLTLHAIMSTLSVLHKHTCNLCACRRQHQIRKITCKYATIQMFKGVQIKYNRVLIERSTKEYTLPFWLIFNGIYISITTISIMLLNTRQQCSLWKDGAEDRLLCNIVLLPSSNHLHSVEVQKLGPSDGLTKA